MNTRRGFIKAITAAAASVSAGVAARASGRKPAEETVGITYRDAFVHVAGTYRDCSFNNCKLIVTGDVSFTQCEFTIPDGMSFDDSIINPHDYSVGVMFSSIAFTYRDLRIETGRWDHEEVGR